MDTNFIKEKIQPIIENKYTKSEVVMIKKQE